MPTSLTDLRPDGHAIEARLYAEDASVGFLPTSGRLETWRFPTGPGLRIDAGYSEGDLVGTHYDAMLAKVIAWAPTRHQAIARLSAALRGSRVHGLTTNRDLLIGTLEHPEFISGAIDTGFLDRHDPVALADAAATPGAHRIHAIAVAAAIDGRLPTTSPLPGGIPSRWRNVGPNGQGITVRGHGQAWQISLQREDGQLVAEIDGAPATDVTVLRAGIDHVVLEADGERWACEIHTVGERHHVDSSGGSSVLVVDPRFVLPGHQQAHGALTAPMPGIITIVDSIIGENVLAGTPIVRMEAMKMEHVVTAPEDGLLSQLLVKVGDQVNGGDLLAIVDPIEESS